MIRDVAVADSDLDCATVASRQSVVHVVDDDESYLRSLERLMNTVGLSVVTYDSGRAFLDQVCWDLRGCLVTDLCMPGVCGLTLQEEMRRAGCRLPVVFLSGKAVIPDVVKAMQGGAQSFVTKDAPADELLAAVDQALRKGEAMLAQEEKKMAVRRRLAVLSPRERQVLLCVVGGKLNKQIASELGIHERTVKLHRTNLTRKLQIYSVAELTALVIEAGVAGDSDE